MRYLEIEAETVRTLASMSGRPKVRHVFRDVDVQSINAALAAERPLLLRGEPGVGKSQLARAAAQVLGRAFVSKVIDARTEPRDLLFRYDAVRRLAAAQVAGTPGGAGLAGLAEENFVTPGPLWWAFAWTSALSRTRSSTRPWTPQGWSPPDGVVVLLDEMDKADSAVPNGLLEALGDGRFEDPQGRPIERGEQAPLVIVTTNEERELPNAFMRRCMVHHMRPGDPIVEWLVERGRAHFPELSGTLVEDAARLLAQDRDAYRARGLVPPGQAEYLDVLRVLDRRVPHDAPDRAQRQRAMLKLVSQFAFKKHPSESGR